MPSITGYKIAIANGNRVLVTLKIPNDATTNISRTGIKDKNYASYRCNKAIVISIEDIKGKHYASARSYMYSIDVNTCFICFSSCM